MSRRQNRLSRRADGLDARRQQALRQPARAQGHQPGVDRGQVIVVLGPSGSGKSTLCRTINRLEPIDSGTIAIDGEVLPDEGRKLAQLRSDVGMVFQSFNLFAHKTILENVTLAPMKVRKKSKDEAREKAMATAGAGRHRQPGRQVPGAAVRRPAAAGGDRALAGDEPEGDAVRRADQRAGPGDDQRGAGRDDRRWPRRG